jgi:hypothetical protein
MSVHAHELEGRWVASLGVTVRNPLHSIEVSHVYYRNHLHSTA